MKSKYPKAIEDMLIKLSKRSELVILKKIIYDKYK
jgi:hypothetical protein